MFISRRQQSLPERSTHPSLGFAWGLYQFSEPTAKVEDFLALLKNLWIQRI